MLTCQIEIDVSIKMHIQETNNIPNDHVQDRNMEKGTNDELENV